MKARTLSILGGVTLIGLAAVLTSRARAAQSNRREHNSDAAVAYGTGTRISKAFTIQRSADDLYREWRDLERLPEILTHLDRVEVLGDGTSRWHARGPGGTSADWIAEIVDDTPGERIAWRSVSGTPNAGSVRFGASPGDRGTELRVEIEWTPPAGPFGAGFARLFAGGDPGLMVETDLRRFKSRMESREIALNGTDVRS